MKLINGSQLFANEPLIIAGNRFKIDLNGVIHTSEPMPDRDTLEGWRNRSFRFYTDEELKSQTKEKSDHPVRMARHAYFFADPQNLLFMFKRGVHSHFQCIEGLPDDVRFVTCSVDDGILRFVVESNTFDLVDEKWIPEIKVMFQGQQFIVPSH